LRAASCPAAALFGHAEAQEGALKRSLSAREVHITDGLVTVSAEALLGAGTGSLGPGDVNLLGRLGRVREDGDPVVLHFHEPAADRERLLARASAEHELAGAERGHEGGVPRQDAELPLGPRRNEYLDALFRAHDAPAVTISTVSGIA
jgi:hypothetical protein